MFAAFDKVFTLENIFYVGKGALVSVGIAALALLFGLILGTLGASGRNSRHALPKAIANLYVTVIRGTPLLLQILIMFSVLPSLYTAISGKVLRMDPLLIGVVAMSINSGAYQTELIRSGINGVDRGQWEACQTLGLSSWKTMKLVILPQAFKRIIPPLISEFITLIKDSSLISCIGAVELLKSAQVLGVEYFEVTSPYMLAAIYYLCMTIIVSVIGSKIEKRLAVSD